MRGSRKQIEEYLGEKGPYCGCGFIIAGIDCFRDSDGACGSDFGDRILSQFEQAAESVFGDGSIVVRTGEDEDVIFVKCTSHRSLVSKAGRLLEEARALRSLQKGYTVSCSIGVSFLPENLAGYTYERLYGSAEWALCRARENGGDCYVFCDHLNRAEARESKEKDTESRIDPSYLHNDIVITTFEILEKEDDFETAIQMLMEVIGIRFDLDRITVTRADVTGKSVGRQYQWRREGIEEVLGEDEKFTQKDFQALFRRLDGYGTIEIQHDNVEMYSEEGGELLVRGGAKTVLYAAMYCEGKFVGTIGYTVCREKRIWPEQSREQLGGITKIIAAYSAMREALSDPHRGQMSLPEYDRLTGLLSLTKFREEVDSIIASGCDGANMLIYSDFENFKYFNEKYGYSSGDQLLRDFSNYVIETLKNEEGAYFTRAIGDQFIQFMTWDSVHPEDVVRHVNGLNEEFVRRERGKYPGINLRVRSGIYRIEEDCKSASAAIDAANMARAQVAMKGCTARLYDDDMRKSQALRNEIVNGMEEAMEKRQFEVYLQPKFSLSKRSVIGAEALIRWKREDGSLLPPDLFLPIYEDNGRIVDLDFYVFEEVARFLARNKELGRRQFPISVNASILHAENEDTVERYMEILERYNVDPSLVEIELTETATLSNYNNVREMFRRFREKSIRTSMDDFGAGYSMLNTIVEVPVDSLKIDRTIIANCLRNERGIRFLTNLLAMIEQLGYHVICEGVETERQAEILREVGCEEAQGYLFGPPQPIPEYERMVYPR